MTARRLTPALRGGLREHPRFPEATSTDKHKDKSRGKHPRGTTTPQVSSRRPAGHPVSSRSPAGHPLSSRRPAGPVGISHLALSLAPVPVQRALIPTLARYRSLLRDNMAE